jgi:ComF family protein
MLKSFLTLFLKPTCPLCQRPREREICGDCWRQLQDYRYQNPCSAWCGDLPRFVWGRYEGQLKRAIATLKYDHYADLGRVMGRWIAEGWCQSPPLIERLAVIPIPLHPQRLQERGFNQAEAIAQGFCHLTGYPLYARGLRRIKDTEALFSLSPEARGQTMRAAFQVGTGLRKRSPLLLIDDIYTTGTTMREAAKVLRQRGYTVVGAIALSSPKPPSR